MKVVLDANIIIAAFATRGLCYAVFELCSISSHEIVSSEPLLKEIDAAFAKKLKLPDDLRSDNMSFLKSHSIQVKPLAIPKEECRDPKDLHVLGLALAHPAQYLVTGDQDLLILKSFRGIPILSPREFWERMRVSSS